MAIEDELEEAGRDIKQDTERLGELGKKVTKLLDLRMKVAEAENHLAEMKRQYAAVAIGEVPDLMGELGLTEVQTQHGVKIQVTREVQCKFIPEVKEKALDWLEENKFGAIIKHEVIVSFGKNSEDAMRRAVSALNAAGFQPEVVNDVHSMTLKSWGKHQIEDGATIPAELFNVNTFSIAKVKS